MSTENTVVLVYMETFAFMPVCPQQEKHRSSNPHEHIITHNTKKTFKPKDPSPVFMDPRFAHTLQILLLILISSGSPFHNLHNQSS